MTTDAPGAGTTPLAPRSVSTRTRLPLQTLAVIAIFVIFGLALIFQSGRWYNTPSYGNLLNIMSADLWGLVHLVIAAALSAGLLLRVRLLSLVGHTAAFMLLTAWEGAFVVRYLTDSGTTVVNVVSWAAYLFLLIWSARTIDDRRRAA